MFSHNGRISERQLRRMLVLSVFAGGIFVIPYMSARLFGINVFWGMCIFFVFACIYVGCIYRLANGFHFVECAKEKGFTGSIALILQISRQLCRLIFFVLLSVAVLKEAQVPFMQGKESHMNLLVVLPLVLVAAYGAFGNRKENEKQPYSIEKQGRLYELIFWVLFVPFIIMLLFGLGDIDWHVFIPRRDRSFPELLPYAYCLLVFLMPAENYLYLRPCLNNRKKDKSFYAVAGTVGIMILLSLAVLGIYGVRGAASEEMLTIAIMRYIKLPLGILGRFDSLVVWFFMAGCFVLISQTIYFTSHLLSALFPKAKTLWIVAAISLLAIIVPVFLPDYRTALPVFLRWGAVVDIPLSLIVPLVVRILKGR